MSSKLKLLPVLIAAIVILGSGYVHGVWSFRWSAARELATASAKLTTIPHVVGDWVGTDSQLDSRQASLGRIDSAVSRQYVNSKTGRAVTILLVCGRPGPISVHTPEVCYAGSGYEVASGRSKVSVDYDGGGKAAQFWSIRVAKPDPIRPERMIIDYGWFSGGNWTAPDLDSRLVFASHPVLYKLYIVREQSRSDEQVAFDPTTEFLRDFLPKLQKSLGDSA